MSRSPHSNDPRDNLGEFLVGKDGQPIVDRYGRPVRRRPAPKPEHTRFDAPQRPLSDYQPRRTPNIYRQQMPRQQMPRQQMPRQQMPRQQMTPQYEAARHEGTRYGSAPYDSTRYDGARPDVPMRVGRPRRRAATPRYGQAAATPAPRRRFRAPGCTSIIGLIVAVVLALVLITDARLLRVDALPDARIANTAGTNWLLVGSDSRTGFSDTDAARLGTGGDIGSTRTDTIMLLHLPLSGQPTLVSIPRDSYVEVPGYGMDKINAAFSYGGAPLLTQTVEQATGLRVDRYAEIGMGGLAGVVDAVGGVEVCVAEPIDDPLAAIYLQPGCQKLDGPTALGYVRTRASAQGDLDRVARQREFLAALVDRATSPAVFLNPFRAVPLALNAPHMFAVNKRDHVWNLARIPIAIRGGIATETVPLGGFADTEVGSVILWDDQAAQQLFASLR